jgi:protein-disulfide isomerase
MTDDDTRRSRRRVLAALAGGVGLLAGCAGTSPGDTEPTSTPADTETATATATETETETATATVTTGEQPLSAPVRGDPEAAVTLEVYEDYACPHCREFYLNGLPTLAAAYLDPGRIRYEHRDLPIPVVEASYRAASAARAVQDRRGEEAFFAFAKGVFERQGDLRGEDLAVYESLAHGMNADPEAVRAAGATRAYDPTVTADRQRGIEAGVDGTPGFVVNGEVVTTGYGDGTLDTVRSALDERL